MQTVKTRVWEKGGFVKACGLTLSRASGISHLCILLGSSPLQRWTVIYAGNSMQDFYFCMHGSWPLQDDHRIVCDLWWGRYTYTPGFLQPTNTSGWRSLRESVSMIHFWRAHVDAMVWVEEDSPEWTIILLGLTCHYVSFYQVLKLVKSWVIWCFRTHWDSPQFLLLVCFE